MNQQFGVVKRMTGLQKSVLDGVFGSFRMMWTQTEAILNTFLEMSPWMPEQGKTLVRSWVDYNKKSCEYFKHLFETSYSSMEMGASAMQMMENTANAAEPATAPLKNVSEATPFKPIFAATPLEPVTDTLFEQQDEQE